MKERTHVECSVDESFILVNRKYTQQYANLYFLRLIQLRKRLLERGNKLWSGLQSSYGAKNGHGMFNRSIESEKDPVTMGNKEDSLNAVYVSRVLDTRPGQYSWMVGTVYCDMSLKPNVLEDLTREVRG